MGNFLKETAAKVAGNVTQSVTSAIIVTLITTYVLVDIKKKDSNEPVSSSDSLKINSAPQSMQQPDINTSTEVERKASRERQTPENRTFLTSGKPKSTERVMPGDEVSRDQGEGEIKRVADKGTKNAKLEASLAAIKAKSDSVAKEKQVPKDVKQVQKRAEDIFDELDEEVAKKPPQ